MLRYTNRYKTKRLGREMKGTSLEGERQRKIVDRRQIENCRGHPWIVRYRDK
jgi:hypothetical protein